MVEWSGLFLTATATATAAAGRWLSIVLSGLLWCCYDERLKESILRTHHKRS